MESNLSPNDKAVYDYVLLKLSKGYTYTNPWWARKDLGIDGKEFLVILNRLKTKGLLSVDTSRLSSENHIYFSKPDETERMGGTQGTGDEKSSVVLCRIAKALERIADALEKRP